MVYIFTAERKALAMLQFQLMEISMTVRSKIYTCCTNIVSKWGNVLVWLEDGPA